LTPDKGGVGGVTLCGFPFNGVAFPVGRAVPAAPEKEVFFTNPLYLTGRPEAPPRDKKLESIDSLG